MATLGVRMANTVARWLYPDGTRHGLTWTDAAHGTRCQWRHLHDQPLFADRSRSAPVAAVAGRGLSRNEEIPRPATAATITPPSRSAQPRDCPIRSMNHRNSGRYLARADR